MVLLTSQERPHQNPAEEMRNLAVTECPKGSNQTCNIGPTCNNCSDGGTWRPNSAASGMPRPKGVYIPSEQFRSRYMRYLSSQSNLTGSIESFSKRKGWVHTILNFPKLFPDSTLQCIYIAFILNVKGFFISFFKVLHTVLTIEIYKTFSSNIFLDLNKWWQIECLIVQKINSY